MRGAGNSLMKVFARILFEMRPADAHALGRAVLADVQPTMLTNRQLILGNLIAFRQIGIEVILSREAVLWRNGTVQRQPRPDRKLDGLAINHGQYTGHAETDRASLGVRRRSKGGGAAAKHL